MRFLSQEFLESAMFTAKTAAEKGSSHALSYFQCGLPSEKKDDNSPVTLADREAEALIIDTIRETFPKHSILGEESGQLTGDPSFRWIIDPIDGTRGFLRGGGFWGSLIGLEHEGVMIAGAMCLPIQKVSYWAAKGLGCFRNGVRIKLTGTDKMSEAILSVGEIQNMLSKPFQESICRIIQESASTRAYGDPGGLMMVLEGLADIWIEAGVKSWDLSHAKILIEEAGGRFTDFFGQDTIESGNAVAANLSLHRQVMSFLNP